MGKAGRLHSVQKGSTYPFALSRLKEMLSHTGMLVTEMNNKLGTVFFVVITHRDWLRFVKIWIISISESRARGSPPLPVGMSESGRIFVDGVRSSTSRVRRHLQLCHCKQGEENLLLETEAKLELEYFYFWGNAGC